MKLLKKINKSKIFKNSLFLFVIFSGITNLIASGSDDQLKLERKDNTFEKIYNQNLIPFSQYDNFESQLKTFLGLYSMQSETNYFQDLSMINYSDLLREIYRSKLYEMTINKNNYIIK